MTSWGAGPSPLPNDLLFILQPFEEAIFPNGSFLLDMTCEFEITFNLCTSVQQNYSKFAMLIPLKSKAHLYKNIFHEKFFRERGVKGAITSSRLLPSAYPSLA